MVSKTDNYFRGMKLSDNLLALKIIANQNGLKLSSFRHYRIAKSILKKSIVYN